jgi:hypothetical protein
MRNKSSHSVGIAAEAIAAAQFARCGYDVSVQYGANQPEYDLIVADGDSLLSHFVIDRLRKADFRGMASASYPTNRSNRLFGMIYFKAACQFVIVINPPLNFGAQSAIANYLPDDSTWRFFCTEKNVQYTVCFHVDNGLVHLVCDDAFKCDMAVFFNRM